MKTLILGLVTVFAIVGCGSQAPQAPETARAAVPSVETPDSIAADEPDVDEPSTQACSRSVGGAQFSYTVTRHTLTTDIDVQCSYTSSGGTLYTLSATYSNSSPRHLEAVCILDLNVVSGERWVFATPITEGVPTQANYSINGHAGSEIDFAAGDCHE